MSSKGMAREPGKRLGTVVIQHRKVEPKITLGLGHLTKLGYLSLRCHVGRTGPG